MKLHINVGMLLFALLGVFTNLAAQEASPLQSTASAQVQIIDTAFYMPQLKRHRRVWICLPKDYHTSKGRYPVLYLQDGQNVFDAATSYAGEWGVDETLDSLAPGAAQCIVVAVDNGGDKRLNEYSPFDFTAKLGNTEVQANAEGDAYVDFLVKTLRPYIRKKFRGSRRNDQQFIAGSSMGGLISLHAVLKYPKKWGAAGVFSPSFWVAKDQVIAAAEHKGKKVRVPIYLYAGLNEGPEMVPDMLRVNELLNRVSRAKTTTVIRAEETHSEASWRREFPIFYNWLQLQMRK